MISSDVGCWQSFEGRLDPAVLRLVGRVHMERPVSEFLATGYATPVADRGNRARKLARLEALPRPIFASLRRYGG